MVFNATFNNISVISWQSVLLVEETGVPRENQKKKKATLIEPKLYMNDHWMISYKVLLGFLCGSEIQDGNQHSTNFIISPFICFKDRSHERVRVMVFNATFNNISVISWQSVLLVEETGVPRENH
jgi:hypothetical protein